MMGSPGRASRSSARGLRLLPNPPRPRIREGRGTNGSFEGEGFFVGLGWVSSALLCSAGLDSQLFEEHLASPRVVVSGSELATVDHSRPREWRVLGGQDHFLFLFFSDLRMPSSEPKFECLTLLPIG